MEKDTNLNKDTQESSQDAEKNNDTNKKENLVPKGNYTISQKWYATPTYSPIYVAH